MTHTSPCILHAIDTTGPGGAETVFLDLVESLHIDGYNNIAIIKGEGWVEDQLKLRGINYYIVNPKAFSSLAYYAELIKIIRKNKVGLIQAHLLGSTLTFSIVSLALKIPLIATIHGQVDVNPNEKFIILKNSILRLGVNKLIAVSNDLSDYIEKRRLFNASKIGIIYNGVKTEKYSKNSLNDIRDRFELNKDVILIGSVGNIRPAKDYGNLIKAAKIVIADYPNIHFIIAGHQKPELMKELEKLIVITGTGNNIHFTGFESDAPKFLGQLDIFLLSSKAEGFSISTIEAMATGLPVVVTRCGGPEEIVTHQQTGLIAEKESPEALADQVISLVRDKGLQRELGASGKNHVQKTFSLDSLLENYKTEHLILLKKLRHK